MSFDCRQFKQIPDEPRLRHFWSRKAFVEWINKTLNANYTNVLEFRNGAPYLHLLDAMFPGVVPMESVKFAADLPYDCYQNFQLLKAVFKKIGIQKDFDMDALSAGRHVETCAFLNWFKIFFTQNFKNKDYDPVKARRGVYIGFGRRNYQQRAKSGQKNIIVRANSLECLFKRKIYGSLKSKSRISISEEILNSSIINKNNDLACEGPDSTIVISKSRIPKPYQTLSSEKYEVHIPFPQNSNGKRVMITAIIEDFFNNHRHEREEYFKRFAEGITERRYKPAK